MLTLLFSASSCRDDLKNLDPNPDTSEEYTKNGRTEKGSLSPLNDDDDEEDDSESMVLGTKLNDPYTMANMTAAYHAVVATLPKGEALPPPPKPTHIYVKFTPQDDKQLEILENHPKFEVYDYPVDFEIAKDGHYYRDPAVPSDKQPTYQYATLSEEAIEFLPDGIPVEKLEIISIPEEEKTYDLRVGKSSQTFADLLVEKSLELTGNLDLEEEKRGQDNTNIKWRPAGNIKVRDIYNSTHNTSTNTNLIPIEGVKVRARRWHRTKSAFTDANGDFSFNGTFKKKRKANYSLKWGRGNFSVRRRFISAGTAHYNGPRKYGDWNLVITNAKQHQYAHVFRGAHHYYYKDILGLERPNSPKHGLGSVITVKSKFDPNETGSYQYVQNTYIKVRTYKQSSEDIYANIIHELAHSAHDNMGLGYHDVYVKVRESWAMGASYALTKMVYPKHRGRKHDFPAYTNVVMDLLDYPSDDSKNNGYPTLSDGSGSDRVKGYTIKQIQDALPPKGTWSEWRDNIKNNYYNATKNEVDRLFAAWD